MSYLKQFFSTYGKDLENNQILPLSNGQHAIWLEQQLYPNDTSNHFHFVAKIHEKLNLQALQEAIRQLVDRHESLRTIFPVSHGLPIRQLLPTSDIDLQVNNCTDLSEDAIKLQIQKNLEKPFDLSVELPCKFILYQQSESEYYFQIVAHHIAISLHGYVRLPAEIAKLYISKRDGKEAKLPGQFGSYSAFVKNQYERSQCDGCEADKDYWKHYLSGSLPKPILPTEPHTPSSSLIIKKTYCCDLDNNLVAKLKEIGLFHDAHFFSRNDRGFSSFAIAIYETGRNYPGYS